VLNRWTGLTDATAPHTATRLVCVDDARVIRLQYGIAYALILMHASRRTYVWTPDVCKSQLSIPRCPGEETDSRHGARPTGNPLQGKLAGTCLALSPGSRQRHGGRRGRHRSSPICHPPGLGPRAECRLLVRICARPWRVISPSSQEGLGCPGLLSRIAPLEVLDRHFLGDEGPG